MGALIRKLTLALSLALTAAVVSSALGTLAAFAQEVTEEQIAAAKEALAASQVTSQFDAVLPNMGEQAKQQLINSRPDAADKISALVDEVTLSLAHRRGDLENEIARLYATLFTVEELNTIAEFYKSEAGRKLIVQTPAIARGMEQAARVWTAGVQRDMGEAIGKKISEAGLQ